MAVYEKEYKLWRDTNVTQRAKLLQSYADLCWITIEMQHSRIAYWQELRGYATARVQLIKQRLDVDTFFGAVNRLIQVADVVQETADPRKVMPRARAKFNHATSGFVLDPDTVEPVSVTSVRNAMEHFTNLKITGGLGFSREDSDGWYVSYRDKMFDTTALYEAAGDLWTAIRSAIDTEAFADFRPDPPIIELREQHQIPPERWAWLQYRGPGSADA